jgi:hypothetical protein
MLSTYGFFGRPEHSFDAVTRKIKKKVNRCVKLTPPGEMIKNDAFSVN